MKTLKRTLTLVLVLVMALGLMTAASAADFTDKTDIQYSEAVQVMAGIGSINGYADGSYKPDGLVTRGEAAKMITYAILGPAVAKTLPSTTSSFTDVPTKLWSAPFIQYCVTKGIVNGRGNGKFDPNGNVTSFELAKMILTAAGYGKNSEYVGSSWSINVAIDALDKGIFTGSTDESYADYATREEAALLIFNGISKIDQVVFSADTKSYKDASTPAKTIGEQKYGLQPVLATVNGVDGYTWKNAAGTVSYSDFIVTDNVIGTSKDGTLWASLIAKANPKYIAEVEGDADYYLNGTYNASASTVQAVVAKRGAIVNFINTDADAKAEKVTVIEKTVATLSAAPVVNADGTVTIAGIVTSALAAKVPGYASLAKGDVVLYYLDDLGVYNIEKAASVTAQLTKVNTGTATSYTIGGANYFVSGLTGAAIGTIAYNTDKVYYVDNGNNVVAAVAIANTTPAATVHYGFLLAYNKVAYVAGTVFAPATAAVEKLQLVDSTGATVVLDTTFTVSAIGVTTFIAPSAWSTATENVLVAYTLSDDGKISSVTEASALTATPAEVTKGNAYSYTVSPDTYYASASTVFFYYKDNTGSTPSTVKVFTGYSNALSATVAGNGLSTTASENAAITNKAVALKMTTLPGASVLVNSYALVTDTTVVTTVEKVLGVDTYIYTVNALNPDGTALPLKWVGDPTSDTTPTNPVPSIANSLYTYTLTNGYVTGLTASTDTAATVAQVENNFYVAGGAAKYFSATTKFYQITKTAAGYTGIAAVTSMPASVPTVSTTKIYNVFGTGSSTSPLTEVFFIVTLP